MHHSEDAMSGATRSVIYVYSSDQLLAEKKVFSRVIRYPLSPSTMFYRGGRRVDFTCRISRISRAGGVRV